MFLKKALSSLAQAGLMLGISFMLGIAFDYFFFEKIPGISFPLFVMLILVGLFGIARAFGRRLERGTAWLSALVMFFSVMVFIRSSILLTLLNIAGTVLLLLVLVQVSCGKKLREYAFMDYLNIIMLPFKFLPSSIQTASEVISLRGVKKDQKVFSKIVKGILMAIPALVIFGLLFSSADLVFNAYVTNIIDIDLDPEIFVRTIIVLIATLSLTGAYAYVFRSDHRDTMPRQTAATIRVGPIENAIFFGSINVLFFAFIFVQLTYLFGGESNITAHGFTYAEYARKGFFELIAVAVISLLLIMAADSHVGYSDGKNRRLFNIFGGVLIAQVLVIMASAFMRLSLYEEAYGFTTLRLYSHAFIIFMAAIFVLCMLKMFRSWGEQTFAFHGFVCIVLFLMTMNVMNPDAFIVRRNVERFETTGKLDTYYIAGLSDDAVPEIIGLLEVADEEVRNSIARDLYWRSISVVASSTWQSLNISRMLAKEVMYPHANTLERFKNYERADQP